MWWAISLKSVFPDKLLGLTQRCKGELATFASLREIFYPTRRNVIGTVLLIGLLWVSNVEPPLAFA
ncbi:MAG: hypothetical protein JSV36_12830, partial [Anaerolineae bacterium]